MAYRFKREDASIEAGVRRIALEQIEQAIEESGDPQRDAHEVVHQVRKRCKKLRGLLRLVRPVFEDYADENARFREAANQLSFVRDSEALLETYDHLVETYRDQIERRAFASIRRRLTRRQKEIEQTQDLGEKLAAFRTRMLEARERAAGWQVQRDGFAALRGGLGKTYKRAQKAMAEARKERHAAAFHEWRKRVKYHWYHTRLLTPIWPGPMKAHEDAADALGDLLGTHHDLAVFRATVGSDPTAYGDPADVEVFAGLIERRQTALEAEAFTQGARLLAEPAGSLKHRWGTYFDVWRGEPLAREAAA